MLPLLVQCGQGERKHTELSEVFKVCTYACGAAHFCGLFVFAMIDWRAGTISSERLRPVSAEQTGEGCVCRA